MAKLIMLSGLPASGKSTRAKEILKQGNWIRVNRDLLRSLLHGDNKWTGKREDATVMAEKAIVGMMLSNNINVVVDDCNLNPHNKDMWQDVCKIHNACFEHEYLATPYDECIRRDMERDTTVGSNVIMGMALQYQKYPTPTKPMIICDVDGTIADLTHRLHFIQDDILNWDAFFEHVEDDVVIVETVQTLLNYVHDGYPFIFVSGRPEKCRKNTEEWIYKNIYCSDLWDSDQKHIALLMRRTDDHRPDNEVKQNIYNQYLKHYPIKLVIDDRPRVIQMWKDNGLEVIDVGKGIDF